MAKRLIFISGPMGVGKSTVCRALLPLLEPAVWLDGDWCWMMSPFAPTEQNKAMVLDNIGDILTRFLQNDSYGTALFSWVMDEDSIVEAVLSRLPQEPVDFYDFSLLCGEEELRRRVAGDPQRDPYSGDGAVARLPKYARRSSQKLDVTGQTPMETAQAILQLLQEPTGQTRTNV